MIPVRWLCAAVVVIISASSAQAQSAPFTVLGLPTLFGNEPVTASLEKRIYSFPRDLEGNAENLASAFEEGRFFALEFTLDSWKRAWLSGDFEGAREHANFAFAIDPWNPKSLHVHRLSAKVIAALNESPTSKRANRKETGSDSLGIGIQSDSEFNMCRTGHASYLRSCWPLPTLIGEDPPNVLIGSPGAGGLASALQMLENLDRARRIAFENSIRDWNHSWTRGDFEESRRCAENAYRLEPWNREVQRTRTLTMKVLEAMRIAKAVEAADPWFMKAPETNIWFMKIPEIADSQVDVRHQASNRYSSSIAALSNGQGNHSYRPVELSVFADSGKCFPTRAEVPTFVGSGRPSLRIVESDGEFKDVLVTVRDTTPDSLMFGAGFNSDAGIQGSLPPLSPRDSMDRNGYSAWVTRSMGAQVLVSLPAPFGGIAIPIPPALFDVPE